MKLLKINLSAQLDKMLICGRIQVVIEGINRDIFHREGACITDPTSMGHRGGEVVDLDLVFLSDREEIGINKIVDEVSSFAIYVLCCSPHSAINNIYSSPVYFFIISTVFAE